MKLTLVDTQTLCKILQSKPHLPHLELEDKSLEEELSCPMAPKEILSNHLVKIYSQY